MPKVMLVEDDKTMLSLLRMLLEFEGYQVAVWEGDTETATVGNILATSAGKNRIWYCWMRTCTC